MLIQPPLASAVVAISSDGQVVTVPLRDGLELGRDPSCGIAFAEPWLAPRHLRFRRMADSFVAEPIGEAPLFLETQRLPHRVLHVGDILLAAQTPVMFQHTLPPPVWWAEAAPLRAAIHEDPDDDDVRLIFADWLSSRDPQHAELIACQIAAEHGSQTAAEQADWLMANRFAAPLAVPVERWTLRRGLVATARVLLPVRGEPLQADHPGCTVISLDYPPPPRLRQ